MERVNLRIGSVVFDHADYDAEFDILYLCVGKPEPSEAEDTPEGHARFKDGPASGTLGRYPPSRPSSR